MKKKSIRKRLFTSLMIAVGATFVLIIALYVVSTRLLSDQAVKNETRLGNSASTSSETLLIDQSLSAYRSFVNEKAGTINQKLQEYVAMAETFSNAVTHIYEHPGNYPPLSLVRTPDEHIALGNTEGNVMEWIPCTEADDDVLHMMEARRYGALYGVMDATLIAHPEISLLYLATESGLNIGIDDKITSRAGVAAWDPRETSEWYQSALKTGAVCFSDVYDDAFGNGSMITLSLPIRVKGENVGVFAMDILVSDIQKSILNTVAGDIGHAVLFAGDGGAICADSVFQAENGEVDLTAAGADEITRLIGENAKKITEGKTGTLSLERENGESVYLLYDKIPLSDWVLAVSIDPAIILAPAAKAHEQITGLIDESLASLNKTTLLMASFMCALLLLSLGLLALLLARLCKKITEPILQLTGDVAAIGNGNLDFCNTIRTGDEIETLGEGFEAMTASLRDYIDYLTRVTAEKERIGAELNVAQKIQASMLPCIFPPFPTMKEFDIYATMLPAKEVGGDFYDFFMIGEDKLAVVIADVSGKGVPAALFMVIAKTLIKNHAQTGATPAEVFTLTNAQLCENNDAGMFVTAFMGVLDLKTGMMAYVNAGHNPPLLRRDGGAFEYQRMRAGFVLAGMDGMRYRQGELQFAPGDTLYLYTDGITEATDAHERLYGDDRLKEALDKHGEGDVSELLAAVKNDVDAFVREAPQFDDMTMLALHFNEVMK